MVTSRQMRQLATNPAAHMRWVTTGRLPQEYECKSPLITLLRKLSPWELSRIEGLVVDQKLGYHGSRTFRSGTQALAWLAQPGSFSPPPSESYRDRSFVGPLSIQTLKENCASFPDTIRTFN